MSDSKSSKSERGGIQNPTRESEEGFKIKQERARSDSKSSKRERARSDSKSNNRESDGVELRERQSRNKRATESKHFNIETY